MHIHILGICGTFMGGIALIAQKAGFKVTGSDKNVYPPMSTELETAGIKIYEGYGAGGVAVFIEAATDNKNRTAGDIRSYFTKFGGNLGETGCVGWIFEPYGIIAIDKPQEKSKRSKEEVKMFDFDKLFEDSMEFDPIDVYEDTDEDDYKIKTSTENLEATAKGLENLGYTIKSAEATRIPSNSNEITDPAIAKKVLLLLEKLDEHDDVQNVYSNFEASDDIMASVDM